MLLGLRCDNHVFAGEDCGDPFGTPRSLPRIVDLSKRLERHRLKRALGECTTKIVPVAAHRERRSTDRAAEVEGENLRSWITTKLECHERQQYALASTRRTDHQRVSDIADVE